MTRGWVALLTILVVTATTRWTLPLARDALGLPTEVADLAIFTAAGVLLGSWLALVSSQGLARQLQSFSEWIVRHHLRHVHAVLLGGAIALVLTSILDGQTSRWFVSPATQSLVTLVVLFLVALPVAYAIATGILRSLRLGVSAEPRFEGGYLLDTSAIIDGRFFEAMAANLATGPLVVTNFVLRELQAIADDRDSHRRKRGRRGLANLERCQQELGLPVQILDRDRAAESSVDDQLMDVAQELALTLVTTDFNLDQVAELRGINVINANRVASAMRLVHHPGDQLEVYLQRKGKEEGQGVGYLDDGTMIVVEDGGSLLASTITVEITSSLQTNAGRMLFAKPLHLEAAQDASTSVTA